MAYSTAALVTAWLGTNYNSTTDLTTAQVTAHIVQADGELDALLSRKFYKFNATDSSLTDGTDTYTTPPILEEASKHLSVVKCMEQIGAKNANPVYAAKLDADNAAWRERIQFMLSPDFRSYTWTYRNETLTFGTNATSWDLDTYQARIGVPSGGILDSGDPPHIIADSVQISSSSTTDGTFTAAQAATMRNGYEFFVYWSPKHQDWIFQANTGDITDHITTLKVTYNWTYERDLAIDPPVSGILHAG